MNDALDRAIDALERREESRCFLRRINFRLELAFRRFLRGPLPRRSE